MFKGKKRLEELEIKLHQLQQEKEELLFIKSQLEEQSPKIDISDVYVVKENGIYRIAKMYVKNIQVVCLLSFPNQMPGYESTLVDIFSKEIIFKKTSALEISNEEHVPGGSIKIYPLSDFSRSILAYPDKQVPLYVLQQLYYKLNKVDVNSPILKKV